MKIIVIILLAIFGTPAISGLDSGFVNGVYTVYCYELCYDIYKNPNTKGYDPKFLSMPIVKQTCSEINNHGVMVDFCDKKLGTL
jgi:hypothetical protein